MLLISLFTEIITLAWRYWTNVQLSTFSGSIMPLLPPLPLIPGASSAQRAVEHDIGVAAPRPLLVVAGAGSGKTNTLAHRVARLVQSGADPQRILLLTFSRRAANEMGRRAGGVLQKVFNASSQAFASLPWAGTFHSIGARLLREYAGRIGLESSFTIHDRADSEDLMGLVRQEIGLAQTEKRFPLKGTCLAIYSRVVNSREPLDQVLQSTFPWCSEWEEQLKRLFGAYVDAKQEQNVLDYDDLLLFWAEMAGDPELGPEIGALFDHVLVDEYQDTNRLQAAILQGMKPDGSGRDGGRRRRPVDLFLPRRDGAQHPRFSAAVQPAGAGGDAGPQLPLDPAHPRRLECGDRGGAGAPCEDAVDRQGGERQAAAGADSGRSRAGALGLQARAGSREAGIKLTQQAVLFRAASHSAALELELVRRTYPLRQIRRPEIPRGRPHQGRAGGAALCPEPERARGRLPRRAADSGIGPATAARLLDAARPLASRPMRWPPCGAGPLGRAEWDQFTALFRRCARRACAGRSTSSWCGLVLPHLERLYDDAQVRVADIEQLVQLAGGYGSRENFLTELTLDPPEATSDRAGAPLLDDDYLILSTIHSAKGQEWKAVHVLNVVDGCIPSDMATGSAEDIEEERRLLYVAMTRAKEHCTWWCRTASSSSSRPRWATAMCMRSARASSRRSCSSTSRNAPGRMPTPCRAANPCRIASA
jgi:DNA helicase-2/ATP-dependent DNA helicase PcrA